MSTCYDGYMVNNKTNASVQVKLLPSVHEVSWVTTSWTYSSIVVDPGVDNPDPTLKPDPDLTLRKKDLGLYSSYNPLHILLHTYLSNS